ncbi:MAG: hypothetical protein IKK94_05805 [Clostridia bacterium]|nr:hypothetical protein [Clostridia bacterium]
MYNRGVQNNNQDQAFYNLSRKFAGRGLARQAQTSADSYGREAMYGARGANSAPLTLSEFENNYRMRHFYSGTGHSAVRSAVQHNNAASQSRAQSSPRHTEVKKERSVAPSMAARQTSRNAVVKNTKPAPAPVKTRERRAVKNQIRNEKTEDWWNSVVVSFRRIPAAMVFMVMLCAVSLMLVVSSSVLVSDASGDYADAQNDVSLMAKEESELLIALEVKNDLRTIENIAVNKLGMVKKDLVSRQYISLGDEDIIESYEEEDRNVGLSTLLSAISKGK